MGNGRPKYELGFSLNMAYKGFDMSIVSIGKFGHQILRSYRNWADNNTHNFTRDILDGRWHGEGTSNKLPVLSGGTHSNWQWVSDIYMENGDFFRIQNLTIGYDLKKLFPVIPFAQTRIFVASQNLLTITGYKGMDPDIGWGAGQSWVQGIDVGFYPSPRTFLFGVNVKF